MRHPGRAIRAARRAAMAIPTALATPWPSGPVVTSTPLGVRMLRMTRRQRSPESVRLDVVEFEAKTAEIELDVERQAGVSTGQHEAVPSRPVGVSRVVPHHLLKQQVGNGRQAHRGAWMAVADVLHSVGGQHPDGVDGSRIKIGPPVRKDCAREVCVGHAHL